MRGFIDLHCHWLAGVDDGAETQEEGVAMLRALRELGFDTVMATPHMHPGLFDGTRAELAEAYERGRLSAADEPGIPELGLAAEHHLDDVVFQRLLAGQGLPYPGGHAALIEFPYERLPVRAAALMFELRRKKLRPVLAHPERYRPVWKDIEKLGPLLDGGTVLLLDVGALAGRYGRAALRSAEQLLEAGFYYAACSDAHRLPDVEAVAQGIERLFELAGQEEARFMLAEGPRAILDGRVDV
ncbi:MAG: protein tyrosine phosphatase [Deltaproteobacteria bacterium]|nr:protein tyrosine phosphatase [Deltaproteobacteria bacterium]